MTLIVLILCVLTFLAGFDAFIAGHERLHRQLYSVAFFAAVFLFSIKYYYGADIAFYAPLYENQIPTLLGLIKGERLPGVYMFGFEFFLSLIKSFHISYWGMTLIVCLIYFYAIHKLFDLIPERKTLALALLVALEYNLIFATFRQCLSVSFFIFMYFAAQEKNVGKFILMFILTSIMHKSGIIFGVIGLFIFALPEIKISRTSYITLLIIMFVLILMPISLIEKVVSPDVSSDNPIMFSLVYHLSFAQKLQPVLILYTLFFLGMYAMQNNNKEFKQLNILLFLGLLVVALFYQFYPLVWRIRSYFIPFLIVYLFNSLQTPASADGVQKTPFLQRNQKLIRQLTYLCAFLFCAYTIVSCYRNQNLHKSKIYETCTVFDLLSDTKENIEQRQLEKAEKYWETESLNK